jgi:uncharacterized protein YkwD
MQYICKKGVGAMKHKTFHRRVVAVAVCCVVFMTAVKGSGISEETVTPDKETAKLACTPCETTHSQEERRLYDLVMAYRASMSLPPIPLSPSLSYVAKTHVRDLEKHSAGVHGRCNMHSWSADGPWTACCYTDDHAQAKCMWYKPKELTGYTGYGFEISAMMSGIAMTPERAIRIWQSSPGHNAVMVNSGSWRRTPWNAIGVGIYRRYSVIWFGQDKDPCSSGEGNGEKRDQGSR